MSDLLADPRYRMAMVRALSLNDLANNYQSGGGQIGPMSFQAESASGGQTPDDRIGMMRGAAGANIPLMEGVNLMPSISGMRQENEMSRYENISPGITLGAGPFNATAGRSYGDFQAPEFRQKNRADYYGGGVTIPAFGGDMSYAATKTSDSPTMHTMAFRAPVAGGDLAIEADADKANRLSGALLRYRTRF